MFTEFPPAILLCEMDKLCKALDTVIFNPAAVDKAEQGKDGSGDAVRPKELMRGAIRVVLSVQSTEALLKTPWKALTDKLRTSRDLSAVVEQMRHELGQTGL